MSLGPLFYSPLKERNGEKELRERVTFSKTLVFSLRKKKKVGASFFPTVTRDVRGAVVNRSLSPQGMQNEFFLLPKNLFFLIRGLEISFPF